MIDLDDFDSPSTHVEFHALNHSLVFLIKNPVSRDLYELLTAKFDKVLLSIQDNSAFLPTENPKKTIREVYMMLREPENQVFGIHLIETKPNPIFFAIENDFLSQHGFNLDPFDSPITFVSSAEQADISLILLQNSIEIKCSEELVEVVEGLGMSFDNMIKGYITNHTLIDDVIYQIFQELIKSNSPKKYKLFKNTKPNFPANFRDAHRADIFFNQLFGSIEP